MLNNSFSFFLKCTLIIDTSDTSLLMMISKSNCHTRGSVRVLVASWCPQIPEYAPQHAFSLTSTFYEG